MPGPDQIGQGEEQAPTQISSAGRIARDGDGKTGADALADARLDEELEETFPASDPVPVNPGAD